MTGPSAVELAFGSARALSLLPYTQSARRAPHTLRVWCAWLRTVRSLRPSAPSARLIGSPISCKKSQDQALVNADTPTGASA